MTAIVKPDLLKGTASQTLTGGWIASRVFIVIDIEGNPDAIAYNAILNGSIPRQGELHPTIPGIIVHNITTASLKASRQMEVTVHYKAQDGTTTPPGEDSPVTIKISASTQEVITNKRIVKKGNKEEEELIILKYTYPEGEDPNGKEGFENEVVGTMSKQVPLITATLSRVEFEDTAQKAHDFVGKLNSKTFIGGEAGLWQCKDISCISSDSGETYNVDYVFQRAQGGWNTDLLYRDETTGRIPIDIEDQPDAIVNAVSQRSADFGLLKLGPFTTSKKFSLV